MANGTLVRKVVMQIAADDGDTEAKLDAISKKADELKAKNPDLAVRIDTAAASAKVAVLRKELQGMSKPVDVPVEARVGPVSAVKAKAAGGQAGQSFGQGFGAMGWLITAGVAAALAALPALAAAGGAAAGIALGAALLVGTQYAQGPLYKQFHDMTQGLASVLRVSALPLVKPLGDAFAQIGRWGRSLYPVLHAVFTALGPLVAPLTRGLEGLIAGPMPGFLRLMQAARPAVSAVAGLLSGLGSSVGRFLGQLAPGVQSASQFLTGLGNVVLSLLPVVGQLALDVGSVLGPVLQSVGSKDVPLMSNAITGALKAVQPLLPELGQLGAIVLDIATKAVVPLMPPLLGLITAFSKLAAAVLPSLIPPLERAAQWLATVADAASRAMSLLSHIPGLGFLGGSSPAAGVSSIGAVAGGALTPSFSVAESAAAAAYGNTWASGASPTSAPAGSSAAAAAAKRRQDEIAQLGLQLTGSFANSLAGSKSAAAAKAGVDKLLADVKAAWQAGVIGLGKDESLTRWLDGQSAQLQSLAARRASIEGQISAARKYAASTASSVYGNYDLSAASGGGGTGTVSVAQLKGNLSRDLTQIRMFSANIQKLQRMGLNKGYLGQLISMGPVQGGELAAELASSSAADIKSVNAAEYAISKASGQLGQIAADGMYDTGKQAGKGFLSGLEAQESQINAAMQKIAKNMVGTLRRELGIHSPSTVGHDIGANFGGSVGTGLEAQVARVTQGARRLTQAMVQGTAASANRAGAAGAAGRRDPVVIQLVGGDREFRTWLKKTIRVTGGNVQVVGALCLSSVVTAWSRPRAAWRSWSTTRPTTAWGQTGRRSGSRSGTCCRPRRLTSHGSSSQGTPTPAATATSRAASGGRRDWPRRCTPRRSPTRSAARSWRRTPARTRRAATRTS